MAVIKLLKEFPSHAPILADWAYGEWYRQSNINLDTLIKAYQLRIDDLELPVSMVALENDIPVGMVSLKENDLWSRKDLNPWLASLFVVPEFRKMGIGSMLINSLIKKTEAFGYRVLYLFVSEDRLSKLEKFYTNRGWIYYGNAKGNIEDKVKIFNYNITSF